MKLSVSLIRMPYYFTTPSVLIKTQSNRQQAYPLNKHYAMRTNHCQKLDQLLRLPYTFYNLPMAVAVII